MKKINIKGAVIKAGAVSAGACAGAAINKIGAVQKFRAKGKSSIAMLGAIKIAVGALIPDFVKGKTKDMLEHAGSGLIAVGGLEIVNSQIDDSTKKLSIAGTPGYHYPTLGTTATYPDHTPGQTLGGIAGNDDESRVAMQDYV